jgi:signal recognition particle GTPase
MNDETQNIQEQNQEEQTNEEQKQTNEPEKKDLVKHLRKLAEDKATEVKKLREELETIKKAEEDKNKTLEEKLFEAQKKEEELTKEIQKTQTLSKLEKQLLANNLNLEFSDLVLAKAQNLLDNEMSIEEVVDSIKTNYPSAFISEKPKPLGKVGISANTSDIKGIPSKERVVELINDPNTPLTPELKKWADEYGIR